MVNPQKENGHLDIANELADQFEKLHLSGNEWQIIWVVLRKTWGWHKKEDAISLTQFQKATGLSRPSVQEAINKLVLKKVLIVLKKVLGTNVYMFNKLYSQWVVPKRVLVPFSVKLVPKKEPKLVPKKEHTKTNKEIYTKESIESIRELLIYWNQLYGTKYKAVEPLVDNFVYWYKQYSMEEMKTAIQNIKYDPYWKDKMIPETMLRRKNQNHESVDYIGRFLNTRPRNSFSDGYKLIPKHADSKPDSTANQ